jgi:CRP-like cAMP-binding protein
MQNLFSHIRQYCHLDNESLESLGAVLKPLELEKGSFLITEGKICQHVYFLEKGCLRGYYNVDSREITYWFAFENNFVTSSAKLCYPKAGHGEHSAARRLQALGYNVCRPARTL